MPARAVLFDLDGTLIDSHDLIVASFQHACREVLARDMTDEEAQVRWGQPLAVRFAAVAPDRVPALVSAYVEYYNRHEISMASVFPGVPDMLDALTARACVIAVVTSKRGRAATQAIQVLGLAPWIATAVGAEDASRPKPAPDPVQVALHRLDVPATSSLMVGDAPFDIQAARAADVRSIAALWGARNPRALLACDPDYVAQTPGDVAPIAQSA